MTAQESLFSAPISTAQMEVALRETVKRLPREEGHYGFAHPSKRTFRYEPKTCPECRARVLEAILSKQVLYV